MRSRTVGVLAAVAGLVLGGGAATAATKPPATVKACVSSTGVLSLLQGGKCAKKTHLTKLSVTGPVGKTGAPGAAGAAGPAGAAGAPGAPGATGPAGPSDVYAWSGTGISVHFGFYSSPVLTVPAGSYVVSDTGLLADLSNTEIYANCNLSIDNAVVYVVVPAVGATSTAETRTVRAGHPFQVYLSCASSGSVAFTADQLSLTVTAVGTLYDTSSAVVFP